LLLRVGGEKLAVKNPDGDWAFSYEQGDPALEIHRQAEEGLMEAGFYWREVAQAVYSPDEICAAPLLLFSCKKTPRGYGGTRHGTEYDLSNACPECDTGAIQVSPLFLEAKDFPKKGDIFCTFSGETLVSQQLREALEREELNGLELRRAIAVKKGPVPWFQIIASQVLPRMGPATKGVIRDSHRLSQPCQLCQRDGFFGTVKVPMQIVYDANDIDAASLPDIMKTWEGFGKSVVNEGTHKRWFAVHQLIVKQRFREVFEQLKVKGVEFVPVAIQ
jgi:hypothetical protein